MDAIGNFQAEAAAGADLPPFVKDEFDAFLECGILTHGLVRLHFSHCGHDKPTAFSCKRRSLAPDREGKPGDGRHR